VTLPTPQVAAGYPLARTPHCSLLPFCAPALRNATMPPFSPNIAITSAVLPHLLWPVSLRHALTPRIPIQPTFCAIILSMVCIRAVEPHGSTTMSGFLIYKTHSAVSAFSHYFMTPRASAHETRSAHNGARMTTRAALARTSATLPTRPVTCNGIFLATGWDVRWPSGWSDASPASERHSVALIPSRFARNSATPPRCLVSLLQHLRYARPM